jgi:hypothetical protein
LAGAEEPDREFAGLMKLAPAQKNLQLSYSWRVKKSFNHQLFGGCIFQKWVEVESESIQKASCKLDLHAEKDGAITKRGGIPWAPPDEGEAFEISSCGWKPR